MAPRTLAYVTPKVLLWARESAGYSVQDAAKSIRLSWSELEMVETGHDLLTLRQAEKLARLYGRRCDRCSVSHRSRSHRTPSFAGSQARRRHPGQLRCGCSRGAFVNVRRSRQRAWRRCPTACCAWTARRPSAARRRRGGADAAPGFGDRVVLGAHDVQRASHRRRRRRARIAAQHVRLVADEPAVVARRDVEQLAGRHDALGVRRCEARRCRRASPPSRARSARGRSATSSRFTRPATARARRSTPGRPPRRRARGRP